MAVISAPPNPLLDALDRLHAQAGNGEMSRMHLGASQIGRPCSRAIWYVFRWAIPRKISTSGYRAIQDGHRGEQVMADWLRAVKGIQLWTEDENGQQFGFQSLSGHFCGSVDGVILGIPQAPKTPHVWEHKQTNEKKFNKLGKLISGHGEKAALALWDEVYFAQAQIYMRKMKLSRHLLTVCTPGNRAIMACRTEYDKTQSDLLMQKAEKIISAERPPLRLSERPDYFVCKQCEYHQLCHAGAEPSVHCRTCAHSTAQVSSDDGTPWRCELHVKSLNEINQRNGCESHAFHPDLLSNWANPQRADKKTGAITFKRFDGVIFVNGRDGCQSKEVFTLYAPLDHDVLAELSASTGIGSNKLLDGELAEEDWLRVFSVAVTLSERIDERSRKHLIELVDQIDKAYCKRLEAEVA